jgi:hypothetical protein
VRLGILRRRVAVWAAHFLILIEEGAAFAAEQAFYPAIVDLDATHPVSVPFAARVGRAGRALAVQALPFAYPQSHPPGVNLS